MHVFVWFAKDYKMHTERKPLLTLPKLLLNQAAASAWVQSYRVQTLQGADHEFMACSSCLQ
jgi:hypothetical protein